ncbi:MFS substrate transporter [Salix suchowensis]|nr:MFS substrate transporter [Salix suchowensis]
MGRLNILPKASGRSTRFSNPPPRRKYDMFWRPSFNFRTFLLRSLHLGGHRTDSTLAQLERLLSWCGWGKTLCTHLPSEVRTWKVAATLKIPTPSENAVAAHSPSSLFPKLFQGTNVNIHGRDEDSAVDDDVHEPIAQATRDGHLPIQYPSPLVNAHLSGYSTNAEPTRHQDTLPRLHYTSEPQTPSQTSPTASSKNSIVDIPPVVPVSPPERLAIRLAAGYFMYFMCGWGDGGSTVGVLHASFFVLMGSSGGYPVLLLAYAFAAYARGIITGFGGAISPLICQTIVAKGVPWNHFYYGSLVLSAFNTCFLVYSFRPTLKEFADDREAALGCTSDSEVKQSQRSLPLPISRQTSRMISDKAASPNGSQASLPMGCLYILLVVLWKSADRNTAGYVTSGFWGGITVGRLLWGRYNYKYAISYLERNTSTQHYLQGYFRPSQIHRFGTLYMFVAASNFSSRRSDHSLVPVVALVMQLLIWFVNSNAGNAFSASMIGVVYGPIFPACLALANDCSHMKSIWCPWA